MTTGQVCVAIASACISHKLLSPAGSTQGLQRLRQSQVPRKRSRESAKQKSCEYRSRCQRQTCSWFPDLEPATLNLKRRLRFALAHVSLETPARCRNPEWVLRCSPLESFPDHCPLPFEAMLHSAPGALQLHSSQIRCRTSTCARRICLSSANHQTRCLIA